MTIYKPSWLRNWLDNLNWDILTWHVYVGDAVESGIDWAIAWLNDSLDWALDAWNLAWDAWEKAVDVFWDLTDTIDYWVDRLFKEIDQWWDDLDDWWDAVWDDILDWVEARLETLKTLISDTRQWLAKLDTAWDNFKTNTLPNLINFSWFNDWVKARVTPIEKDLAQHSSWFDLLKELMVDPEKWLLDRIISMLARFI